MNELEKKNEALEEEEEMNRSDDATETDTETDVVEEEEGATPTPEEEAEDEVEEEHVEEKMLSQSQVNELVGRARQEGRESALKELEKIKNDSMLEGRNGYISEMLSKYGVNDESELDNIFGNGQAYDSLNEDYLSQNNSLREMMAENALLKSKVRSDKFEDIKLILGGKGLDVTVDNIEAMLPTHPEWVSGGNNDGVGLMGDGVPEGIEPIQKPTTLGKLGADVSPEVNEGEQGFEKAKKLFGL